MQGEAGTSVRGVFCAELASSTAAWVHAQVLKIQPENPKALFRRGVARHALGQTEGALEDLQKATKL